MSKMKSYINNIRKNDLIVKVLMKIKTNIILLTIARFYFCFLFGIRSLFIKESPWTLPIIALILESIHYFSLSNMPHEALYILTGCQLIIYDNLGSFFSKIFNDNPSLAVTFLVVPFSNEPIKRFVGLATFFLGKTAMTAGGRATIIVGATVIGGTFLNSYLDRKAADTRSEYERKAADTRSEYERKAADTRSEHDRKATTEQHTKMRAYQNYQDARKEFDAMPFYKKAQKPQWDENHWSDWSKSK